MALWKKCEKQKKERRITIMIRFLAGALAGAFLFFVYHLGVCDRLKLLKEASRCGHEGCALCSERALIKKSSKGALKVRRSDRKGEKATATESEQTRRARIILENIENYGTGKAQKEVV